MLGPSNKFENESTNGTQFIKGYPWNDFAEKKSEIFYLKSTENWYRVPLSSLLFNECTVIGTGDTFLAKYRYLCFFKEPSAQLWLLKFDLRTASLTLKIFLPLHTHL